MIQPRFPATSSGGWSGAFPFSRAGPRPRKGPGFSIGNCWRLHAQRTSPSRLTALYKLFLGALRMCWFRVEAARSSWSLLEHRRKTGSERDFVCNWTWVPPDFSQVGGRKACSAKRFRALIFRMGLLRIRPGRHPRISRAKLRKAGFSISRKGSVSRLDAASPREIQTRVIDG